MEARNIREKEYTKFDENEQGKYQAKYTLIVKNNNRELRIVYRRYPIGYGNYEELNAHLTRHGRYTKAEFFLIRMNWNGTGKVPLCETKLKINDDFYVDVSDNNDVKEVVIRLFSKLKDYLEDTECSDALQYFPQ